MQSLANIDLLKITYWNPTSTVHDVLKQIKEILLEHAQVDVESTRNDATRHPEGAYHPIEDFLIKMALVGYLLQYTRPNKYVKEEEPKHRWQISSFLKFFDQNLRKNTIPP